MTSLIICDITTALLKYGNYIEKLKLAVQAVYVQIMMICTIYMCKYDDRSALLYNLKKFKSFTPFVWNTVAAAELPCWTAVPRAAIFNPAKLLRCSVIP